jgi:hypothetical protein
VEQYDSHDLFRADNHEAMEIRKKSSVAAMEDAVLWLKEEGNVAVSKIMQQTSELLFNNVSLFHIHCSSYEVFHCFKYDYSLKKFLKSFQVYSA